MSGPRAEMLAERVALEDVEEPGPRAADSALRRLARTLAFVTRHPLTRNDPLAALARFARWQVASRLREEIEVPWIGEARLAVRRGMTGATGNIYCGLHEFADMAFLLHLLRPGDLFIDVGANVGSYTILATKVCGASTLAFEPDPGTAQALRRNIRINGGGGLATVHACALGARSGEVAFTTGLDTMNRVSARPRETSRVVPLETMDSVLAGREPTLIKLDVEGYEEEVLDGARHALRSKRLLAVETELRSPRVDALLMAAGFVPAGYHPFERSLTREPATGAANALYVRELPVIEARVAASPRRNVVGRLV